MSPFQVSGSRRKVMNWDSHVHQLSNKHMPCANIKIMEDFAQMCGSLYFLRTTCRAGFFFFFFRQQIYKEILLIIAMVTTLGRVTGLSSGWCSRLLTDLSPSIPTPLTPIIKWELGSHHVALLFKTAESLTIALI